jgi:serine/threonine protein kinase
MNPDPSQIARLLPFEDRYERRRQRWLDGPHGSWEAFDRVLEREVVLNVAWGYSDVPAFIRSARAAASFRHPGFLPVHDLGIVGGTTPFYTTPPVPGVPLGCLIRGFEAGGPGSAGSFPLLPLVGAVRDASRALEYAHRRGLLHLDLHPDRLLIGDDHQVILDVHDWRTRSPREGGEAEPPLVFGFPAYLSPEQIAGKGSQVGPAADVFGLGGILHVILFGTPPNRLSGGKSAVEVIRAIAERSFEPRRPGTLRPGIRPSSGRRRIDGLVGICLKALAYEPEGRYPTAAALGDALDGWLARCRFPWWAAWSR